VFVVGVGQDGRAVASELVRALRVADISAASSLGDRPLKAQLKMADRAGARFAAIVGDSEARAGTVTLRRLSDGAQETVAAGEAPDRVREGDR
jgi:histidyl-tRNA synthetase